MRLRSFVVFLFAIQLFGGLFAAVVAAHPLEEHQIQAAASPQPPGAPVVVDGKTLFYVPARMFTFSPADRARTIAERIEWLSKQPPCPSAHSAATSPRTRLCRTRGRRL